MTRSKPRDPGAPPRAGSSCEGRRKRPPRTPAFLSNRCYTQSKHRRKTLLYRRANPSRSLAQHARRHERGRGTAREHYSVPGALHFQGFFSHSGRKEGLSKESALAERRTRAPTKEAYKMPTTFVIPSNMSAREARGTRAAYGSPEMKKRVGPCVAHLA